MPDVNRTSPFVQPDDRIESERTSDESDSEEFDRAAFALRALEIVRPMKTTVAICAGMSRLRVDAGRAWGRDPGERWALVSIPNTASRRAIALALSSLLPDTLVRPYALDALLAGLPAKDA